MKIIEKGRRYRLGLDNSMVKGIYYTGFSSLHLLGDGAVHIEFWQPMELKLHGRTEEWNPRDAKLLLRLAEFVGRRIEESWAEKTGRLELKIDGGFGIVVSPGPWEAWQLRGDDGLHILCPVGGNLAIWEPDGSKGNWLNF